MDEQHKKLLQCNNVEIIKNLHNVGEVVDGLYERGIFTESMKEEVIEGQKTTSDKARKILDTLRKRGPEAFGAFLEVLADTENGFIAKMLKPGYKTSQSRPSRSIQEVDDSLPTKWPDPDSDVLNMELNKCTDSDVRHQQQYRIYPMEGKERGRVLIINNMEFDDGTKFGYRQGSDIDVQNIKNLFEQLFFKIEVKNDLTAQEIKTALSEESQMQCDKYRCFILFILSHGEERGVFGKDGEVVEIKEISDYFDGRGCPVLWNSPKLFFIQACQGENRDSGSYSQSLNEAQHNELVEAIGEIPMSGDQVDARREEGIPTRAHFFIAKSTTQEYVSYRHTTMGSWFILAIAYVFKKLACKENITSLMTKVNELVSMGRAVKNEQEFMAVSTFQSTLTQELYFMPGV